MGKLFSDLEYTCARFVGVFHCCSCVCIGSPNSAISVNRSTQSEESVRWNISSVARLFFLFGVGFGHGTRYGFFFLR